MPYIEFEVSDEFNNRLRARYITMPTYNMPITNKIQVIRWLHEYHKRHIKNTTIKKILKVHMNNGKNVISLIPADEFDRIVNKHPVTEHIFGDLPF